MTSDLEDYLGYSYSSHVILDETTDGGEVYLASHPELPGCMAHGSTPEEALANLAEARELYIGTLLERGIEVPKPCHSPITAVWRHCGVEPTGAWLKPEESPSFNFPFLPVVGFAI